VSSYVFHTERDFRRTPAPARREQTVALDPLTHPSWDSLVAALPGSSFFHGSAWARVLQETYGHRPFYFCRLTNGRMEELLPVMEVSSLWTGRRGVSLPFTDFCPLLGTGDGEQGARLHTLALERGRERHWRYLECKSNHHEWPGSSPALVFYGHVIDLDRGQQTLCNSFQGATRRNLRRAQAAGLRITFGNSPEAMQTFYSLHNRTRRRHGTPPQGFRFFNNIVRHVLSPGHGFIVTAWSGKLAVAAAVYFHQGRQAIYKFGASDYAFQRLRPNNLVMWEAIKRYAADGFTTLHLGRTSLANQGLRRYKLGFGAREERIENCRYDFRKRAFTAESHPAQETSSRVFRCLPLLLLRLAGRMLYPHLS
jgi:CelD/BcsL family acetyltransferase involved in cellulose biosynthesis